MATDAVSKNSKITNACGPYVYYIKEAYPFLTVDNTLMKMTLQTNNMTYIGVYTATFSVGLVDYPLVPPATTTFSVTLKDPCLVTTLALPSIQTFTITAFVDSFTQTYTQATDSAANSALVPDLCGPRVYVIKEA